MLWALLVTFAGQGCESTPRRVEPPTHRDDFGEPLDEAPITEESVAETQMLGGGRGQVEIRGGIVVPVESNFEVGPGLGIKGELEVFKKLFMGLSFDWSHHEADEQIKDSVVNGDVGELLGADPTELFESLDRYNILAVVDYDYGLTKNFFFRFGLGVGLAMVFGDEGDNADSFVDDYEIEPFFHVLVRPAIDFRYKVWEHGYIAVQASYDFIPQDQIEVHFLKEDSEVDEDINFSSFNLSLAWVFEF
jgi:hypothetical protein